MAANSASTTMSFPQYTFDLSERLRQAARSTLAEFEASIIGDSYNWLESYIDTVEKAGTRAPIADLIKTPSRTATAKKTRAAATATINRAEQVKAFNARLALSPLADRSPARQLFSPLQEQSINSPHRVGLPQGLSPTKSPLAAKLQLKPKAKAEPKTKAKAEPKTRSKGKGKAKADAENIEEAEKPPPKKRGRPKKNAALDESTVSKSSTTTSLSKSVRSAVPKSPSPAPAPKAVEPTPAPEPEPAPEAEPEVAAEPVTEATDEPMAEAEPEAEAEPAAPSPPEPIVIDEAPEEVKQAGTIKPIEDQPIKVEEEADDIEELMEVDLEDDDQDDEDPATVQPHLVAPMSPTPRKMASPIKVLSPAKRTSPIKYQSPIKPASPIKSASPFKKASPVRVPSPAKAASPLKEASPFVDAPAKSSSPIRAAEAPAPTRQVRSSWLTQALGDRPVPMGNARQSTVGDAAARKPLTASLKRKSEEGPDADNDDKLEAKRAEKVARFDSHATDAATGRPASPQRSSIFASRQPGSAQSLPSANIATPSASSARHNPTSVPNDGRSKHNNKVHSALEELRERTAAAAAAKQQKSAAASKLANATKAAPLPSTGSGFLRGLGNLGAGLLGFGALAASEDEATRLRREDDDRVARQQAEAELARFMRDMAEEEKQGDSENTQPPKSLSKSSRTVPVSESSSSQMGDVAIVVDDDEDADDESEDDERNASITLPELPRPDIGDEYDDEPFEDGPTSALGAAGIDINFGSTTPPQTPPLNIKKIGKVQMPEIIVSPPPKEIVRPMSALGSSARTATRPPTASSTEYDDDDEDMDDDEDDTVQLSTKKSSSQRSRVVSASSSRLSKSSSTLSQAERIAAKALGVKSAAPPVKSLQRAAEAAKRQESAAERKAAMRAELERRKQEDARRKKEAERVAAEEERERKRAEQEERRKRLVEAEKRRERAALQVAKDRAAREEREAAEAAEASARAAEEKAAEEEAARKRKIALVNKAQQAGTIKRIIPTAGKAPVRLSKSTANTPMAGPSRSSTVKGTYRTEETYTSSTIKLVSSTANRPGMPSTAQYTSAQTLQQKRQTLQAQLDQKVIDTASEDIVLPDIASEYSDSDDSDKETDFVRPAWAESPELNKALAQQAFVNPDELFGQIRPLNMDELFKQRQGKFRARTSSANWSGTDRLTEAEEREYARRMGFRPLNAPRDGGSAAGDR